MRLTQNEVAKRIGVSQNQVSKIERGDMANSQVSTIQGYLEALGKHYLSNAQLAVAVFALPSGRASTTFPESNSPAGWRSRCSQHGAAACKHLAIAPRI